MEINLNKYTETNKKAPKHETAASVNEIIRIVGESKQYDYKFWLARVKNVPYSEILDICKRVQNLDKKYNRGGYINNCLKNVKRSV